MKEATPKLNTLSWGDGPTQYFFELTPDHVMDALEQQPLLGVRRQCTGYCQPLGSFENRVYEVEFEDEKTGKKTRAVTKFYRPGRWSRTQILEEHLFMQDMVEAEIPVVVPHYFEKPHDTLRESKDGLFFCVYPKVGGRQPEDLSNDSLRQLGRLIARMHTVGGKRIAPTRVELTPQNYGDASLDFLLRSGAIDSKFESRFQSVVLEIVRVGIEKFKGEPLQRIHGDCHAGNILMNEKTGPSFIDFDDMVMGPKIQDLWLLAPDPSALKELVAGYRMMGDLPEKSIALVEVLRALRMIHYATWIAKRYDDPAFKIAFPQFKSPKYWEDLTYDLEKQLTRLDGTIAIPEVEEFEGFWDDED